MAELLTAAQMRAAEAAAIVSGAVTGLDLMERAGRGVVEAVFGRWPELARGDGRAMVLCGPGNNGGDGYVVARLLKEWGWEIGLFALGDPAKLPADAGCNRDRWLSIGGDVLALQQAHGGLAARRVDLIVDALFGTGLTRPLTPEVAKAIPDIGNRQDRHGPCPRVVAVDIPSGICSDSGRNMGNGWACDLTVTFHRPKPGHYLGDGPARCGSLQVVDIGLPAPTPPSAQRSEVLQLTTAGTGLSKQSGHKFTHGHALVLSGGAGRGGAARMAARAALRVGAGLVTLGCPADALPENAAQLNAIMLRPVSTHEDLSRLLVADARINALCLGPGLGTGARERRMVAAALGQEAPERTRGATGKDGGNRPCARATVLDADALTLIAAHSELFAALHENCVLTPHAGEFARLFPDLARKLDATVAAGPAYSKVDATRDAAARAGCVVLFKGPDTVIAAPEGRCAINTANYNRAAPWLATAGSGDVLSGLVLGLLARGLPAVNASRAAAWLHVECALQFGAGLIAEDLPEILPQVLRSLPD